MAPIYRSVRVVFLNATDESLVVQGCGTLTGDWAAGLALGNGETVPPQSVRAFATTSMALREGTAAYARFGGRSGHLEVHWTLPWVGELSCEVQAPPHRRVVVRRWDDEPAAVLLWVTIESAEADRSDDLLGR